MSGAPDVPTSSTTQRTGWYYALPALPLSALALIFYVFLPKLYTGRAGVSLGTMGWIILFTRMWDAVLDPLIGRLSDSGLGGRGRRRPWIAVGSVPLAVATVSVMTPGLRPLAVPASWWFAANAFLFFLFWTSVSVPYEALGAELSPDYHERTRILAKRDGLLLVGTVVGSLLPLWSGLVSSNPETGYCLAGVVFALLTVVSALLCVKNVSEPLRIESDTATATVGAVFRNKPFMVLLFSYALSALGGALPASLILYYVEDVLGSSRGPLYLLVYLFTGCVFLPLWVRLSAKIEKKSAWLLSMALNTGAFSAVFFLTQGQELGFAALVFLSGVGAGATLALPSSMQADVIDYDEWLTGKRREGLYVGLWSVVKKAAAGLGAAFGFLVLDHYGYQGGEQGVVSEQARLALRALYAAVPSLCNFLAIAAALPYALTRAEHARIRGEIEERIHGSR